MRKLPLYPTLPRGAYDNGAEALDRDVSCKRCESPSQRVRSVCMPAEGTPGGLLLIDEAPGTIADQLGRPFVGGTGQHIRELVARSWQGPVAYDHAVRCAGVKPEKKAIAACRPYGVRAFLEVSPTRIICFGNASVEAVLGHRPAQHVRRGYGFVYNILDDAIPVFFLLRPHYVMRNRFLRGQFELDLKWAINYAPPLNDAINAVTFLVETAQDAEIAADALAKAAAVLYDVETVGKLHEPNFRLESVTLGGIAEESSYTWTRAALRDVAARRCLARVLAGASGVITQNGKYDDQAIIASLGSRVAPTLMDTRLVRKLIDPEAAADLDTLGYLVGLGGHKGEAEDKIDVICKELRQAASASLSAPSKRARKPKSVTIVTAPDPHHVAALVRGHEAKAYAFAYLDDETLYRYNARDVAVTRATARQFHEVLVDNVRISNTWRTLTRRANEAVKRMEYWGIAVDRDALINFDTYCTAKLDAASLVLSAHAPGLNPNSPKQVAELLYNKLKLRPSRQTPSGAWSTDDASLAVLAGAHPVLDAILLTRKYSKLRGTYAQGMLPHIRSDGRIHPSILIDGTRTGRFSCTEPNLQNIPRAEDEANSEDAAMARNCFIAPRGSVLLELDYSQIELRVAALLSQDKVMIQDYRDGIDLHMNNATACCTAVWGIPRAQWDQLDKKARKPYRTKIKTATFAKLYGKTASALAREWGVPLAEVEAILTIIWGRYKRLNAWTQEQIAFVRRNGYVYTWWDGAPAIRRPIYNIADPDEKVRRHSENESVNTPVQGTAAHFTAASLPKIVEWLDEESFPAKLVLTVHDSIMLEVREKYVAEAAQRVREIMISHNSAGVPLDVEAKVGTAWGLMEDFKVA